MWARTTLLSSGMTREPPGGVHVKPRAHDSTTAAASVLKNVPTITARCTDGSYELPVATTAAAITPVITTTKLFASCYETPRPVLPPRRFSVRPREAGNARLRRALRVKQQLQQDTKCISERCDGVSGCSAVVLPFLQQQRLKYSSGIFGRHWKRVRGL